MHLLIILDVVRAPCPMLNTLANHGFLNHDGKNINRSQIEYAFNTYLNINTDLASNLFGIAVNVTVPNPNATTFDLDDLSRHNLLEHDGSLRCVKVLYILCLTEENFILVSKCLLLFFLLMRMLKPQRFLFRGQPRL